MGRFFSTVYHLILVIFSVSALALSILSATSCQFLAFDHQYKGDRRYLSELEHGNNARALQDEGTEDLVIDPVDDLTGGDGEPADETPAATTVAATDTGTDATTAGATDTDTDATTVAATDTDTDATTAAATDTDTAATTVAATDTDTDATTVAATDTDTAAAPTTADVPAPSPSVAATPTAPTTPPPTKGFNITPDSPTEIQEAAGAASGSSDTVSNSAEATAAEEPVATASGDAGLYCDGEKSFSVTNLWEGSIQDLEAEIATESDTNQSEELARNAVLAATVFGSIIAFVLVMESIIGWRVWCERWILGLVAIMACISQGITFVFFNSQRYCDGDIVNEILNHTPCVMGQGGVFSVVATVLYGIIIILACRLPKDDPYGLCKKSRDTTYAGNSKFMGSSGPLSTDDDEDGKPERPNWLSEEQEQERDRDIGVI